MTSVLPPNHDTLLSHVQQKVVIVTGAASGIGLAISQLFAECGTRVIMVDVDLGRVEAASNNIHGRTTPFQCDVSSWDQQVSLFQKVVDEFGPPDIVCCNAGIDPELKTAGDDDAAREARDKVAFNWLAHEYDSTEAPSGTGRRLMAPTPEKVWGVNVKGVIYAIKLAVHHMQGRRSHIIVTGSAASYMGTPNQDIYAASKHALLGLVRSAASRPEFRSNGIALAIICPWLTSTPLVNDVSTHFVSRQNAVVSEPVDVARAVAQLVCMPPAEATGKCLWIQGKALIEVEDSYARWLAPLIVK